MNQTIMLTPADVIHMVSAAAALIVSVNAAVLVFVSIHKKAHHPEEVQNKKISSLEDRIDRLEKKHDTLESTVDSSIKKFEVLYGESLVRQRLMIKSLQALSEHAIDGNNKTQLQKSVEDLNEYLLTNM